LATTVLLVLSLSVPAYAQSGSGEISPDDLEDAASVRRATAAQLAAITAEFEENAHHSEDLEKLLTSLTIELSIQERRLVTARIAAKDIARELYMAAGSSQVMAFFDSASVTEIPLRQGYMDLVSATDAAALNHLEALEVKYLEQQDVLEEAAAEQAEVTAEVEALGNVIMRRLEEAEADYRGLVSDYQAQEAEKARLAEIERLRRLEEERLRREAEAAAAAAAAATTTSTTRPPTTTTRPPSPPPVVVDGRVCPIDGPTAFSDTWGARRSGGRTHEGVDMISPRNTPLVAIETGKIRRMGNGGLGGVTIWVRGDSGDDYYYAHLEAWADGLRVGQRVDVGELIGFVGNSGNAKRTITHLHFEYHPDGGRAVNPYPLARDLCL
jgi:murein DD-endopeptidase MepM/ murein hydrolase activator NlpD